MLNLPLRWLLTATNFRMFLSGGMMLIRRFACWTDEGRSRFFVCGVDVTMEWILVEQHFATVFTSSSVVEDARSGRGLWAAAACFGWCLQVNIRSRSRLVCFASWILLLKQLLEWWKFCIYAELVIVWSLLTSFSFVPSAEAVTEGVSLESG